MPRAGALADGREERAVHRRLAQYCRRCRAATSPAYHDGNQSARRAVYCTPCSSRTKKLRMPSPRRGAAGPVDADAASATPTSSTATASSPPFPDGHAARDVRAWAASGAPSASSGRRPGVYSTAVGYAGGTTPNPTYEEVCSGMTGHTEVVLVVYDPTQVSYEKLLQRVLGEPRSDPGHAAGQRRRHAVPLGHLRVHGRAEGRRRGVAARCTRSACAPPATARSRPRSSTRRRSITPRTITSSTWARTRAATAASAAPACRCPIGLVR